MQGLTRAERIWTRILGVLLILLGLALFASPQIAYTWRETIPHSQYTVRREKIVVVPRLVAALVIGGGVVVLMLARRGRMHRNR
jgi:hypothetical protein